MTLRTARLTLEPWKAEDWIEFRPIATDPEVVRYINGGVPWTDAQIQEFLGRQIALYEARSMTRWKLKEGGRVIGFCGAGLMHVDGIDELELGWWVARDRWGLGFATEAAGAALADLRTRCYIGRVISIIHVENRASQAVAGKLGMRIERETSFRGFPVLIYATA